MSSRPARTEEFENAALPHLHDLYRTAVKMLGDRARAEDVVQEVYLQAWKSFERFTPGTNCRAWLYKILIHTVHHERRGWFGARVVPDSQEVLDGASYTPPIPEQIMEREILQAIETVPPDYRTAVLLADVEEFSYKDIAHILNVPIGTVMSRLSRGRSLLRERLAEMARSYGLSKGGGCGA